MSAVTSSEIPKTNLYNENDLQRVNVQGDKDQRDPVQPPKTDKVWGGRVVFYLKAAGMVAIVFTTLYELGKHFAELAHDKIWVPDVKAVKALKKELKLKFNKSFVKMIKNIPGADYVRLFKRLAICSDQEKTILNQLQTDFELSDTQLEQIIAGAHVRLDDEGKTYDSWAKLDKIQPRISSHPSDSPQYGIRGPFVKELLFSRVKEKEGKCYTWFQLENHPVKFGHYIRHMLDYFRYKITKENQGPYGSSPATDSKPLILKCRKE